MLTFLIGGARSGKSTLAVQLGERFGGPVTFVATAEAFDDDLAARITRHRDERPSTWTTIEEPVDLAAAVRSVADDSLVIVDCLTVWLANLAVRVMPTEQILRSAHDMVDELCARRARGAAPAVVVSNEVGMGIVPDNEPSRSFRDELGRVNQLVAAAADTTLLLVAGRAVQLESPWDVLP
ncbi:MAG TPA: bifunctional adenosylcobinamide kinase/adenosylcobinamide-phosphate guanylyltransferase [Ilumatobacteraceae bacterium]|nr:bifunctional adenosylcobinamide kinase/adenosylcobinamide-phosphate guanylyltransferase [Ilumatobacteraceae bacterium]